MFYRNISYCKSKSLFWSNMSWNTNNILFHKNEYVEYHVWCALYSQRHEGHCHGVKRQRPTSAENASYVKSHTSANFLKNWKLLSRYLGSRDFLKTISQIACSIQRIQGSGLQETDRALPVMSLGITADLFTN